MTLNTFFWHDYETFGTDPQRDLACQFAGIRTDTHFNIIGDPVMLFCKPSPDYLPQPEACLITGILPQYASLHGLCEAEFTALIHAQLMQNNTCNLGYNSLRFDDEITRNLLYRNFYDPYAREWQNGNSRWDLIDVARATQALRPNGINWPLSSDGVVSFRLEELTRANNIVHEGAHDAMADVYATIALAKLIYDCQPKLFNFLYSNRSKSAVIQLLQLGSFTPLVHISGRIAAKKNCLAIIVPICVHPTNHNEVIVYDLSADPSSLLKLSALDIRERVFTANAAMPDNMERISLKTVHLNKCPVLAPITVIRDHDAERLNVNKEQCIEFCRIIASEKKLDKKLASVFINDYQESINDPDLMIYSGGFFNYQDKAIISKIPLMNSKELLKFNPSFKDIRLPEMLFRYKARNYPTSLTEEEKSQWRIFCQKRLENGDNDFKRLNLKLYLNKIQTLKMATNETHLAILNQLEEYAFQLKNEFFNG